MKLSLSMIVRGGSDPDEFRRSLKSIVPFVDEVCIVETYVTGQSGCAALEAVADDVCNDLDVPMAWQVWEDEDGNTEYEWISDFSKARNMAQEMVTGDLWCWMDSDTILVNGAFWRDDIEKHFAPEDSRIGVMRLNYLYDFEADGQCNREVLTKMVWRSGISEWEWPLHEQCKITQGGYSLLEAGDAQYHIRHIKSRGDHDEATDRNLWILDNYMRGGGEMHARMWISMATCQMAKEEYGAALEAIRQCLTKDPAENDKWRALSALGGVLQTMGHYDDALSAYGEMTAMHPERRAPWVYIAQTHCGAGQWREALAAVMRVQAAPAVSEGPSFNPMFLAYSPLYSAARAYAALGEWERAIEAFEGVLKLKPDMSAARDHMEALREQVDIANLYSSYKAVERNSGSVDWRKAPAKMHMIPEVTRAKMPKRPKGKPVVMLYCGPAKKPWGPSTLASGLGGSEEAVVYLSRELVEQGYHVEVYAFPHPDEAGVDDHGVVWVHYGAWEDRSGIFVQWRGVSVFPDAKKASARYLWLHDCQYSMLHYTDKLKTMLDGVFCLSEFHAQPLIDHGWGDKVIYTKNGLPPSVLEKGFGERKKRSFAFYSSPDRGLDALLSVWRDIRYRVIDATLDIYYGFNEHYLHAMASNPRLRVLKDKIESQLADLRGVGITVHGMVGHEELHDSMAETDFLLYPSMWPETSMITAMKCMALGCIPITARYEPSGAVETIGEYDLGPNPGLADPYGDSAEIGMWVDKVVEAATMDRHELDAIREEMSEWSRETYSWARVAEQWASRFQVAGESPPKAKRKASPVKAS